MDRKANSQDIIEASKFTNIHKFITSFQDGYEMNIGPEGERLSVGQKQLVALARAFYKKPRIVILDEPNSNLDQYGELCLMNSIDNARKEKITTIIITHKKSILQKTDRVITLADGKINKIYENKKS